MCKVPFCESLSLFRVAYNMLMVRHHFSPPACCMPPGAPPTSPGVKNQAQAIASLRGDELNNRDACGVQRDTAEEVCTLVTTHSTWSSTSSGVGGDQGTHLLSCVPLHPTCMSSCLRAVVVKPSARRHIQIQHPSTSRQGLHCLKMHNMLGMRWES